MITMADVEAERKRYTRYKHMLLTHTDIHDSIGVRDWGDSIVDLAVEASEHEGVALPCWAQMALQQKVNKKGISPLIDFVEMSA